MILLISTFNFGIILGQCEFSFALKKFHIKKNQTCELLEKESWMDDLIEEIVIDGKLIINDEFDLHLKFKRLVFGETGKLLIGQKSSVLNHSIVFENLSS